MEDRTIWRAIQFRLGRLYFHDVGGSLIGFCCNEKVQTTRLLPRNALLDSRYFVAMFFFCQTTFFFFLFVLISLFYRIGIIFTFAFVNLFEKNLDRKKRKKKKTTKLDSGSFYTIPFSFGSWLLRMLARPPWRATIKVMGSEYLEPDIPSHERFGAPSNLRVCFSSPFFVPFVCFHPSFILETKPLTQFRTRETIERSLCRSLNRLIQLKVNF